ncbi:hypothetical protein ACGFNV_36075 [Streptomyces sp. NPDC048751]
MTTSREQRPRPTERVGQPLPKPVGQELDAAVRRRSHRGEAGDQPE